MLKVCMLAAAQDSHGYSLVAFTFTPLHNNSSSLVSSLLASSGPTALW